MDYAKFEMMSIESLRIYLIMRNKSSEGDFRTLVSRYVMIFVRIHSLRRCVTKIKVKNPPPSGGVQREGQVELSLKETEWPGM